MLICCDPQTQYVQQKKITVVLLETQMIGRECDQSSLFTLHASGYGLIGNTVQLKPIFTYES